MTGSLIQIEVELRSSFQIFIKLSNKIIFLTSSTTRAISRSAFAQESTKTHLQQLDIILIENILTYLNKNLYYELCYVQSNNVILFLHRKLD